jgi:hypothetical protein
MSKRLSHRNASTARLLLLVALPFTAWALALALAPTARGETTSDPGHVHTPTTPAPTTQQAPATPAPTAGPQDKEAPGLEVYSRKKQDVDRLSITVYIHEAGSIEVSASARGGGSAARAFALRSINRTLKPHIPNRLRLSFSRKQLCAVKRRLTRGSMKASVKVTARDKAGNARSASRSIALRRERKAGCRSATSNPTDALLRRTLRLLDRLLRNQKTTGTQTTGTPGTAGATGPAGRSALSSLQPGETIRGVVGGQMADLPAFSPVAVSATLPVPAPVGLSDASVVVDESDESPATEPCQGTAAVPTAAPGYVCIYPHYRENVFAGFPDPSTPPATKLVNGPTGFVWGDTLDGEQRYGFQVQWFTCGVGMTDAGCPSPPYSDAVLRLSTSFFGNWAYTAPGTGTAPPDGGHTHGG